MTNRKSLQHTKRVCKYHVVLIPKYRRKAIYGDLRRRLGEVFRQLARRKEGQIEEGYLMADHVHLMISIPPKHSVKPALSSSQKIKPPAVPGDIYF